MAFTAGQRITASMLNGLPQKIQTTTITAATASVVVSLPTGLDWVQVAWTGRADGAGVTSLGLQFNGDSGNNYIWQFLLAATTTQSSGTNTGVASIFIGDMPGSASTANYFGLGSFTVAGVGSSVFKQAVGNGFHATSSTTTNVGQFSGQWLSTAAITSLTLLPASGNFVAGSTFSVYGMS